MKIASLFLLRAGGRNIHKIRIHSRTHSSTFIHPSSSCLARPPHNTYYDTVCCSLRTIIYSKTVKLIWSRSVVTRTVVWEQVRSFGRTPYERKRQQRCLNHFSVIKITPGARDVGFLSGGMFYEQILSLSLDSTHSSPTIYLSIPQTNHKIVQP